MSKKNNVSVSVIVPNFNHAPYLRERIDSILNQNYQDFEIILLDDCSTDDSRDILLEYAGHPKVTHYIVNRRNSGSTFKQWKKGLKAASGRYIWIAESDDFSSPDFLDTAVTTLKSDCRIGMVYCQSMIVDENSAEIGINTSYTDYLDSEKWLSDYVAEGLDEINQYFILRNTIPNVSAVLFDRRCLELLRKVSGYSYMGDWAFYCHIMLENKIAYISKPLNNYRVHGGTVRSRALHDGRREREYFMLLSFLLHQPDVNRNKVWHQFLENCKTWNFHYDKLSRQMNLKIGIRGLSCLISFLSVISIYTRKYCR